MHDVAIMFWIIFTGGIVIAWVHTAFPKRSGQIPPPEGEQDNLSSGGDEEEERSSPEE